MSGGWTLVSNPYLATLQINTTNPGIDNQVQVWEPNGPFQGTYQAYMVGDNAILAPFQAYMVHKTAVGGTANYVINASDRVRTPQTFYAQNDNELDIMAQNVTTGLMDQTMIAFNSHATDGFDPQYDADKFAGTLNRHTLYSLNNNKWMARNVLNSVATTSTVPVGFEPGATGNYAFTFNKISTFDPTTYIYLEDKQTGVMYNVRNGDYLFTSDSADEWNRFVIHFTPPALITSEQVTCSDPGSISIEQPGPANWNYVITDAQNTTLSSGVLNESSPVNVSASAGTYTLKLVDNNNYTVSKSIQVGGAVLTTVAINGPATATTLSSVTFTCAEQSAATYTWYFSDGSIITGTAQATYTFTTPGTYTVLLQVTSATGCTSSATQTITITGVTGLNNLTSNGELSMWSFKNVVYVDFSQVDKVDAVIKIYNVLGQELSNEKYTLNSIYQKQIDNIEAAYVIVSVKNDDNITTRKLFIIGDK
jgi:PKD repeat protein